MFVSVAENVNDNSGLWTDGISNVSQLINQLNEIWRQKHANMNWIIIDLGSGLSIYGR